MSYNEQLTGEGWEEVSNILSWSPLEKTVKLSQLRPTLLNTTLKPNS
jgi:hypothetical protein